MNHKQQLPAPFKPPGASHTSPAVPFPNESSIWEVYINESVVVDNELVKDWTSSLNFLLVFAAIFSSILSAFIIESKKMLEQDPAEVMADALIFFINNSANGTHTPYSRASFSPAPYAVSVNCLLFASLSASIVAALASVVSLQWVAEYDAAVSRSGSSPEDRVKRRQFRYSAMEKWKMRGVIEALPVLLYCSLVLFFVGLGRWMWSVHTTVGSVVIGGTLLGAGFYLITTMLAVVFPSSPYRAPIVRWIYMLFHTISRPFTYSSRHSSGNISSHGVGVPKTPFKIRIGNAFSQACRGVFAFANFVVRIPSRFQSPTVQGRDQAYIKLEQKQLVSNSLAWIAQNVSISRDSHRRLLLLLQEALNVDENQWLSRNLQGVPWGDIVHLLASEYAKCAASRKLTEEDERELVVIFLCLQKLGIGAMVDPEEKGNVLPSFKTLDEPGYEGIDPMHLLFHDIGVFDASLPVEAQIELRVGYLNQLHYLSQSIHEIRAMHKEILSKGMVHICDFLIPRLSRALAGRPHDDAQDRIDNLIFLAHLRSPALRGPSTVTSYRNYKIPVSRPSMLIQRLKCINWIQFQTLNPHIHEILDALLATHNRDADISPLWRLMTTDEEVATTFTLVDAQYRDNLKGILDRGRRNPYLIEMMQVFDELIAQGCNDRQRWVLIELICNELRMSNSSLSPDYFDDYWNKQIIEKLRDPWIQFVACLAAGMDEQLDHLRMKHSYLPKALVGVLSRYVLHDEYFIDIFSAQRVRMRWWNQLAGNKTYNLTFQALTDLETLDRLQVDFTNPGLGVDYGGDFILEITHSPYTVCHFPGGFEWGRLFGWIPALLSGGDCKFYPGVKEFKSECISRLLEFVEDLRHHPGRLVRLLAKLAWADYHPHLPPAQVALNLYYMVILVKNYCITENSQPYIVSSYELADVLERLRDMVIARWGNVIDKNATCFGDRTLLGDKDTFSVKCTQAIHGLLTPSPTTFGIQTNRTIACARPLLVADAATGWLGMYNGP